MNNRFEETGDGGVRIFLTRGQSTVIDAGDLPLVSGSTWYAKLQPDARHFYAACKMDGRFTMLHRYIMGNPPCKVDHRDGDTLNNRRSNLRTATGSQNSANRVKGAQNGARYKGVGPFRGGRWRAQIKHMGQVEHVGLFATEEEAARAYDAAALKFHGEFARLNFPQFPKPQTAGGIQ